MKATKNKSSRSPRARFDATKAHEVEIPQDAHESSLPVVGIGASAGGLEAFTQLLAHLPLDTGMAFVLVQHLDSTHESLLTELLSRTTEMPVNEVSDGMAVEPNHIYVIPRNTNMAIAGGVLHLRPRQKARGQHRPIDYFLRSLAEDQTTSAIGDALKQGEAQIKESRDYAEAIVGTVSRSLVILDEDLRVQMASRYFYDTFKVTRVNTETRLIYELGNHQWDIPALRELLEDILLRHGQFQGFEIEREFEHIGHRTMLLSAREIVQDTSRRRLILLDIEDITERKRAEEEIRQSAERLRFMAESMPQKIFTAKPDGNVDYFNQQWMEFTGLSFEQIKDWGWAQFIHSDDVEENIRRWQHSVATGEPFQFEHRFRRADGVYRWHLSRAHAMRAASGKVLLWIGSNTDIDDVKHAEEERRQLLVREQAARVEAEHANRLKDEFLATLSHELRAPLTAILGWTTIFRNRKLDEARATRALEIIERSARVQNKLITDLLEVSRIITGKLRLNMSVVDLVPVVLAAIDVVRPTADTKNITLSKTLDPEAGLVSGDADRLQQVVWNLLFNAVKFTPKGGKIEVRLEREDMHVVITVSDTGQGIRPEFLPFIFDRFSQGDAAMSKAHGGMGLGLSIVRHLVESHGGTVRADSSGQGQGATFTVMLPLLRVYMEANDTEMHAGTTEIGETSPDNILSPDTLRGLRVMVVDDETDTRELLSFALTDYGAEVRECASVAESLRMLDHWQPDVLVSDIGMPGEDGYDLIRKVRARAMEHGGTIPAVALTGYASTEDEKRAYVAGYQIHVPKPVELDGLASAVAKVARAGRP